MNFLKFLYSHFPHRWLDSKAAGTDRLFSGLSSSFNYVSGFVDIAVRNSRTETAVELLSELEDEYGIAVNGSADINIRRARIIAQKRAQDYPITKWQLIDIFRAVSIVGDIENYHNEQRLEFIITENAMNISYREIYGILNANVRAHVEIIVVSDVDTELRGIVSVDAFAMQSIEYECTTLGHEYLLCYGSDGFVPTGAVTAQEIIFDTNQNQTIIEGYVDISAGVRTEKEITIG